MTKPMTSFTSFSTRLGLLVALLGATHACGDLEGGDTVPSSGGAGQAGIAGESGSSGNSAGTSGQAGSSNAGTAGTSQAGTAGSAGTSGAAGSAATGGTMTGGTAGTGASSGTSGTGGTAGGGGTAGNGGTSGTAGTAGTGGTGGTAGNAGTGGNAGSGATSGSAGTSGAGGGSGSGGCGAADLSDPATCGTCDNNCLLQALFCEQGAVSCLPSANPGVDPGTCQCLQCSQDQYDLDNNGSCEYHCVQWAADDSICNNVDDDCDGIVDEDVDLCTNVNNCGTCGRVCDFAHALPVCVLSGSDPCSVANTQCEFSSCECNGVGDCWFDVDDNPANGCEYQCDITNGGVEICDGLDNDCDGLTDGQDDLSGDPTHGVTCYGGPNGECAAPAHAGLTACIAGISVCVGPNVLLPNAQAETCNGKDDDCDGIVDDTPSDATGTCGVSSNFPCKLGVKQCINGSVTCVGAVDPKPETCNGIDDDCDGVIDSTAGAPPADSQGTCNVPIAPPVGATSPCHAGSKACVAGLIVCQGSAGPTSPIDACGVDSNCDGSLTSQPDLQDDATNCGSCGNNCFAGAVHANWSCIAGGCVFQGCENGYYDLDGDNKCEYSCAYVSAQESCNGLDDNCNGQIDEGVVAPSPTQVCGVSPNALTPECTSQVSVSCLNGSWACSFPAGVCPGGCSANDEICDNLDNDCDGLINENVSNFGQPCASDDGLAAPGHGACRTTGTFACNGANATTCSAVKANCATLPGGCTELCDGVDNDCDGLIDEPFSNKGTNSAYFVKPVATKVSANLWIYTYEASRSTATNLSPGTGNGFWTSAPIGTTLDKTTACSSPSKIPWYSVTPLEVEQVCAAMGGSVCTLAQWQTAAQASASCTWGYNPRTGGACTTAYTASKFCNIAPAFDFDTGAAGDQDGLLPTASALLLNCWADWSGLQGNTASTNKLYDITGNLREITKSAVNVYPLMGGSYLTQSENGAASTNTSYTVTQNASSSDAGFRCCFTSDPSL